MTFEHILKEGHSLGFELNGLSQLAGTTRYRASWRKPQSNGFGTHSDRVDADTPEAAMRKALDAFKKHCDEDDYKRMKRLDAEREKAELVAAQQADPLADDPDPLADDFDPLAD